MEGTEGVEAEVKARTRKGEQERTQKIDTGEQLLLVRASEGSSTSLLFTRIIKRFAKGLWQKREHGTISNSNRL